VTRYAIRRGLTIVPVLVGVSLLVFSFVHMIPGDPALTMLGERATPEKVAEIRARLGLDRPLWEQYLLYVKNALQGDLGVSIVRGDPVAQDLWRRFPATVELAGSAIILATLVGVPAGVVCAVWRNSLLDSLARVGALTGVSMPIFWLGLVLAWIFGVQLGLLPTGFRLGTETTFTPITNFLVLDAVLQREWTVLGQVLRHLILPAVSLATIPLAVITRMTRASLLEELTRDYIRTAQAKGLSQLNVVMRHGLRNALLPVLTVIGLQTGRLLAGAILTETIFSWPGIGLWVFESIESRDYAIVQGATLFIAVVVVAVNLVTDLLYAVADPRIKYVSTA
jgi:peptide/nickel transport system permease protein